MVATLYISDEKWKDISVQGLVHSGTSIVKCGILLCFLGKFFFYRKDIPAANHILSFIIS